MNSSESTIINPKLLEAISSAEERKAKLMETNNDSYVSYSNDYISYSADTCNGYGDDNCV